MKLLQGLFIIVWLNSISFSTFAPPLKDPVLPTLPNSTIYLPLVAMGTPAPTPTPTPTPTPVPQAPASYRINVPYFPGNPYLGSHFAETAITWFGQISPSSNYSDVRVGYGDQGLTVYISTFDRYLWYNPNPSPASLTQWDGATLLLDTAGSANPQITSSTYQFVSALSWSEARTGYQAAYQGNNGSWTPTNRAFSTLPGYRGSFNDGKDSRGWAMTYDIPYSSLGLSGPPPQGTLWGIAVLTHNRDTLNGPASADQTYPSNLKSGQPNTWAQIHFGLPSFTPPASASTGQVIIRRPTALAPDVPDAAVGGTSPNLCPGDANFIWNLWGNTNYSSEQNFSIQNQSDISDWPCFAKYYVTFALDKIPANVKILSANLTLHQQGQAGDPGQSYPSLIQVMTIAQDWNEKTITWNNAPVPVENVSQAWVTGDVVGCGTSAIPWPCVARTFDLAYAVSKAYAAGTPLRLVLYESDDHQHSGKYFTSSDTGDWNTTGRPTLTVNWTNP